jgi:hypothetical protein
MIKIKPYTYMLLLNSAYALGYLDATIYTSLTNLQKTNNASIRVENRFYALIIYPKPSEINYKWVTTYIKVDKYIAINTLEGYFLQFLCIGCMALEHGGQDLRFEKDSLIVLSGRRYQDVSRSSCLSMEIPKGIYVSHISDCANNETLYICMCELYSSCV